MTVSSTAVALPGWVVVKLWEWAGHGRPHPVVGGDEHWTPPSERRQLETAVMATLEEQGLAHDQVLLPPLRDALWVLANAERECHGWLYDVSGDTGRVLVASADGRAVRYLAYGGMADMAVLEPLSAVDVARGCVAVLPQVKPARIRPLHAREADCLTSPSEVQILVKPGAADPRSRLKELTSGSRTGVHRLHAAVRRDGERHTGPPVTVLDIADRGRVALYRTTPPHDEPQLHCVAGDPAALVAALAASHSELSAQRKVR